MQCNFLTDIFDLVYLRFASNAQRVHLCAELTTAIWMLEPVGEVGANFSLQLSSRTHYAKIKKLSPKINVKNIKHRVYQSVKMFITLEPQGTFRSNFA